MFTELILPTVESRENSNQTAEDILCAATFVYGVQVDVGLIKAVNIKVIHIMVGSLT